MDKEIKDLLKELINNEQKIPRRFWFEVLWLQHNEEFGIERSGRIHWKDKKDKKQIRSWKGYFTAKERSSVDEKRIKEILNNYLLIINQNEITARDIIHCQNAEIRRYLLREYGFDKFFYELSGEIINKHGDSELIKLRIRKNEAPLMAVKVRDSSSGEIYILRVPPSVRTCKEAIAWTFGLEPDEYNPSIET